MFRAQIFCLENKPQFNAPHVAGNHLHRNQNPAQGSSSLPSSPLVRTFVSTWPGGCEQMRCHRRRRIREERERGRERERGKRYSERARGEMKARDFDMVRLDQILHLLARPTNPYPPPPPLLLRWDGKEPFTIVSSFSFGERVHKITSLSIITP